MRTAVSWARRLGALTAVIVLVVGAPIALVAWGRLGALRQTTWRDLWVAPDGGTLLLAGLTVLAWWAWLCIVSCLATELVGRASRGRLRIRVPGTGWFRPVAAVLAVAILGVGLSTGFPRPAVAAAAAGAVSVPAAASTTDRGSADGGLAALSATSAIPVDSMPEPPAVPVAPVSSVNHVVVPGDDLWSLAQRYLGDGSQWRHIVAANPTLVLDPGSDLPVGMVLVIPVPAPAPAPPAVAAPSDAGVPASVVVAVGDTLWGLADRYLGDGDRWPQLYEANRDVVADPGVIEPGWRLRIPAVAAPSDAGVPASVVVAVGDTLWGLADRYLGDGDRWPQLYEANRDVVADPGVIEPGWRLRIPGPAGQTDVPAESEGLTEPVDPVQPVEHSVVPSETADVPTRSEPPAGSAAEADDPADAQIERDMVREVVGPIGVVMAGLLLAAVLARRRMALRRRPLGRRLPRMDESVRRFETALAKQAYFGMPEDDEQPVDPAGGLCMVPVAVPNQGSGARRAAATADSVPTGGSYTDEPWAAWGSRQSDESLLLDSVAPTVRRSLDDSNEGDEVPHGGRIEPEATCTVASEFIGGEQDDSEWVSATSVRLGTGEGDAAALCDLAGMGALSVVGPEPATRAVVAAVAGQLVVGQTAARPDVVLVGQSWGWLGELSDGTAAVVPAADDGVVALQRAVDERRNILKLSRNNLDDKGERGYMIPLIGDAERCAGAAVAEREPLWPHTVFCFDSPVSGVDVPALADVGLTAVVPTRTALPGSQALLVDERGAAHWSGSEDFEAQGLTVGAQAFLGEIAEATSGRRTEPAPWWDGLAADAGGAVAGGDPFFTKHRTGVAPRDDKVTDASEIYAGADTGAVGRESTATSAIPLTNDRIEDLRMNPPATAMHPRLLVLGPVWIANTRGVEPSRAAKSCAEYLGWLMLHSGGSSIEMGRELMVAEGTRRSNMSRLRNWLGEMSDGSLYIPDAYSGSVEVDPSVTSDWDALLDVLGAGVALASDEALEGVLQLMRGAPLADSAPSQWHWAEEWRVDMAATIRDAGAVLAQRALDRHDLDEARWAASRALMAAPEDDLLMMIRIRTEYVAGNRAEVQRLTMHITRQVRDLGIDLSDEMAELLQEVSDPRYRLSGL